MRIGFLVLSLLIPIQLFAYPAELKPCEVKDVEGQVLCGSFLVEENREIQNGRKIHLNVIVLPAKNRNQILDPLFILQGGPGQAATRLAGFYASTFMKVRENRDIVLVDQRGTGNSNGLYCKWVDSTKGTAEYFGELFPVEKLKQCKEDFEKRADLRMYTTAQAILDLEDVRKWLGFERVNLYGTSYGTIVGLQYIRMHPESLRSVVLKGVAPPNIRISVSTAGDAEASLQTIIRTCEQDAACKNAYPNLKNEYETVIKRIHQSPVKVKLEDSDVLLSHDNFVFTLRTLLHAPVLAIQVPMMLHRAYLEDYVPLAQTTLKVRSMLNEEISLGMFFTVYCSEDIPFVSSDDVTRETKGTFHGDSWFRAIQNVCQFWPRGQIPSNYREPVRSDIPVLLISGGLDPVTPPRLAQEAARTLSNSRQITVEQGGHSFSLMTGCVENIIASFIESGSVKNLDDACTKTIQRPPFFAGAL